MNVILIAVVVLGAIGLLASLVLFFASKKFAVHEDPRIGQVAEVLPQANCGGCGFPGCSGFAAACVKAADAGSLEGKLCPVGGQPVMEKVAGILGMAVAAADPKVAVVRCNGTCANRPRIVEYDGAQSCRVANTTGAGETACQYGCLGCGDCVKACKFGAIKMNPETGLPEVDAEKCTACGACAKACPRNIIEIRPQGRVVKGTPHRVWVDCVNKDKGPVAMKACTVSCIGCGLCQKACKFEAITIENNLAYIDPEKCKACGMCVNACKVRHAIHATWEVPVPKPKPAPAEGEAAKPAAAPAAEAPKAAPVAEAPKAAPAEETKPAAPAADAPKAEA